MREISLPLTAISGSNRQNINLYRQRLTRWTFAACFFAMTGFLLVVAGFLTSILAYLEAAEYEKTNSRIGGLLIFAAFPLFFIAAHALDKIALNKRAEKIENYRNNGVAYKDCQ